MTFEQCLKVHSVKLIASENQLVVIIAAGEAVQMLTNGIGGSLKPVWISYRLLRRQHLDKALEKRVESVAVSNMLIERRGVELCHHEDLLKARVEAIADRNIDQPVLPSQRH